MHARSQLLQVRALLPIALPRNIAPADKFKKGLENVWGFTTADMCASESDILKVSAAIITTVIRPYEESEWCNQDMF
jgi:hypothetical protein